MWGTPIALAASRIELYLVVSWVSVSNISTSIPLFLFKIKIRALALVRCSSVALCLVKCSFNLARCSKESLRPLSLAKVLS
jgi:hypothetical protein